MWKLSRDSLNGAMQHCETRGNTLRNDSCNLSPNGHHRGLTTISWTFQLADEHKSLQDNLHESLQGVLQWAMLKKKHCEK